MQVESRAAAVLWHGTGRERLLSRQTVTDRLSRPRWSGGIELKSTKMCWQGLCEHGKSLRRPGLSSLNSLAWGASAAVVKVLGPIGSQLGLVSVRC